MARTNRILSYDGLRVLIAGGGVAALEAAFALRALAADLVDIELLAAEPRFFYRPQAVFEPFSDQQVESFELSEVAEALEAQLTLGALGAVSPHERIARTTHGMTIRYDVLLIACGASPRPALPDALTFRGPADSDRVASLARDIERGDVSRITLAIPRRRTWPLPIYELAFGLRAISDVPVRVVTVEPAAGAALGRNGSEALTALLAVHDIAVETNGNVRLDPSDGVTVAAPALAANRILGIPADDDGFIPTSRLGTVEGLSSVYAAGDVTSYEVKHGSIAAAQADAAAEAIAARAGADVQPTPFRAVLHAHLACGVNSLYIRHDLDDPRDDGIASPDPLWSPAGKIFARHLAPAFASRSA